MPSAASKSPILENGTLEDLKTTLRPHILQFLQDLPLIPLERFESEKLQEAVFNYAQGTGVPFPPNSRSYQRLIAGYCYADNCLPYHDLEVKVFVAIYTWLFFTCDDAIASAGGIEDLELFQERWLKGEKQPSTVLQAWADHNRRAYDLYDNVVANLIVAGAFNFMSITALAEHTGMKKKVLHPSPGGHAFAWYMREKDGLGEGFAWFMFPKAQFPDLDVPIEAMADMNHFLCDANDVLSFYKETLAGDVTNYISTRAAYSGIDNISALKQVAKDCVDSVRRINTILSGKGEYERAWQWYATGFVQMHVMRGRYRLVELGVGGDPEPNEVVHEII